MHSQGNRRRNVILGERARPQFIREHPKAGWLAVGTVCLGAFMGQLDASIVTLTFPAVQREFLAPLAAVQWISLAYLLTLVGLVAAAGRVADAFGRKLLYGYGFALFSLSSAACALAPGLGWLIAFRVVQAVGAALLQANSVALVVHSVPRHQMREALGVQAAAQALGLALGPPLGGLLVVSLGWQWVFWVNVPVGFVALIAGHYLLPRTRERTPVGRFDWPGLSLLAVASTAFLLALSGTSGLAFAPAAVAALFLLAVLAAGMFVLQEQRATSPLVALSLVRPRHIWTGLVGALCAYMVLFGPLALLPQVLGRNAADSARVGLTLTALPAGFAIAALAGHRMLPEHWGSRLRASGAAAVCVVALAGLMVVPGALPEIAVLLVLLGIGLGVFIPANNAAVMGGIPVRASAMGGGLVNMSRGMGTALGVTLVTLSLHLGGHVHWHAGGAGLTLAGLALAAVGAGLTGLVPHPSPAAADNGIDDARLVHAGGDL